MPRTTAVLVGGVIEVDTEIDLDPFIDTANMVVTDACTGTNGPSTAYSEARLEMIERWLSAHFYAVRDRRAAFEQAGSVSAKYENYIDAGFASTMYGTQAMMLDPNGGLAALSQQAKSGKRNKIGIYWIGR